ncbi:MULTISPECIES: redoxin domain-containing protein [Ruegeria]|uniref:redoxin domain-containing protein n=1 Tax=Ruegeria TaxID=97050 RepID=UPI0014804BA3|nr:MULTISPECIES: redoxin domain-containing protein [Ruegeria]MBO9411863.1 redoxin domain-containing protein [Ruegeria sp. R8_1]MBO9415576.1 redoxin domain-containing protein [Ruegeria sp. R8_2]
MLTPGNPVPGLKIDTVSHGSFDLDADKGENGTLVIQYRGLHCPICIKQMTEVEAALDDFAALGVEVIMVTTDTAERAAETAEKAGVSRLRVGHSLPLAAAREDWGLQISTAREGSTEPAMFAEPGHFYIGTDRTLYYAWQQTTPFGRPAISDIVGGLKFTLGNDYPPRGTYTGPL